jgi:hypothetical protein
MCLSKLAYFNKKISLAFIEVQNSVVRVNALVSQLLKLKMSQKIKMNRSEMFILNTKF